MATNLVSLIMNFLTPDMIGRLASALGLDRNDTSSAIEAGVPGLLAALTGVANRPGGPQRLADAAHVLATQPTALQLRYLQTLTEIGVETNTTIVFPLPIDILSGLTKFLNQE